MTDRKWFQIIATTPERTYEFSILQGRNEALYPKQLTNCLLWFILDHTCSEMDKVLDPST